MQVIKLTKNNSADIIKMAVKVLRAGGAIVYPTETAYGLGADFLNPKSVKKVYQIKGRDFKKQLSVMVSSLAMAKRLVKFDKLSLKLAKKHWPGALTLVLQRKDTAKTLALRISANQLATAIVKKIKNPLTATSANLSGQGEFYSAAEIVSQFKNKKHQPDLIIDAGKLLKQKPSTIVKVIDDQINILRQGSVKV
ncbi:MAG: L-threonylcarbamoyladenylate synthase [Candidatus Komeilibacteria bacterium]|nr:L-threonylcarbamoyladenylate synthase [Candidatus Komeilibacteria bacterium]